MKARNFILLAIVLCAFVISGCAAFQVAGDIQRGRMQLINGDPQLALAHFQRAAKMQPDYVLNYSLLEEGVWTYVGRAHYNAKNFSAARQALEKARASYEHDHLAKIYLGLVLGRGGDTKQGIAELEAGMRGLRDWLNYIEYNRLDGQFWDPAREIRSELNRNLTMIASGKVDWETLTHNAEWIGYKTEVEVDLAKDDAYEDRVRDGDDPWE